MNYKYRMHDPRLGRFFAVDPLAPEYPHNSPYAFSENVVINAVELEGLERKDIYNVYLDDKGGKTVVHVSTSYDSKLKSDQRVANYFDSKGDYIRTGRTNLDRKSIKIANPKDFIGNQSDTKDFDGIVQNASDYEYEQNFVTAALKDVTADIWNACYQPVIDGGEQVVDPNSTVSERLGGVVKIITTLPSSGGKAPKGWIMKPSKKGGGTVYQHPENPHTSIREMPGNPKSQNASQQNPYVIFKKDGVAYDVDGKPLKSADLPEAHIPKDKFDINKMPKLD